MHLGSGGGAARALRPLSIGLSVVSVLLGALAVVVVILFALPAGTGPDWPVLYAVPVVPALLTFTVVCAGWSRRYQRRFAAASGRAPAGWAGVDVEARTAQLRSLATRASVLAVVCAVVVGAAVAGIFAASAPADVDTQSLLAIVGVLALAGAGCFLAGAAGWRRRHRAVTTSGWRAATATVTRGTGMPDVTLTLDDGTRIRTQTVTSSHGAATMTDFPDTPVQVGGAGRSMVVLFPRGLFRDGPYAVPVKSTEPQPGARPTFRSMTRG
jgi:cytochrome bd-type quinol oxidase subunit 2